MEALKRVRLSESVRNDHSITTLTKTKEGDLLVRFNPGEAEIAPLAKAFEEAMGDLESVREIVQYTKIVVQDLDEIASAEEVLGAIATATDSGTEVARVVSTLDVNRGQKWIVVSQPAVTANRLHVTG